MDWDRAIDINRSALLRMMTALFAMAGLVPGGGAVETVPRHVHCRLLSALRPAESAARRLIVILANSIAVVLKPVRPRIKPKLAKAIADAKAKATRDNIPAFPLFDTRKRFPLHPPRRHPRHCPRIVVIGHDLPPADLKPWPAPDDSLDANRLCKRLQSLRRALNDLPAQAQRLARMKARRKETRFRLMGPMRPGLPPGFSTRQDREVDGILVDCHALACWVREPPDILRRRLLGSRYRF